jgi:hypothetical protein
VSEIPDEMQTRKVITLCFLQGRKPDQVGRPFFARYDPDAAWIDELQPAFGEDRFFFEEQKQAV